MRPIIYSLVILNVFFSRTYGQTDETIHTPKSTNYDAIKIVDSLNIPWGMTFLPDGSMLITEKTGSIILFKNNKKIILNNVPTVFDRGQGGLLDIEIHPNYAQNGWIYFTYSSPDADGKSGNTCLMRAKLKENKLIEKKVIYQATPYTTKPYHFGSRVVFDNDGYVYFGIGDRGEHFENPQDKTKDGGKIYRLKDDGSIPDDNPFVDEKGAKKAIFSYGLRNPQGMTKHPITGEIWENEHGPQGGDEINIIQKGKNYGWPVISYGIDYDSTKITDKTEMPGMEQPFYYYVPSIAPSGMTFVYSDKYPDWKGNLLIGSLKFQYLERLVINDGKVSYREKIMPDIGRVRNVKMSPDGYIYVAVEGDGIYKIISK